jgi:hypothetical protein
VIDDDDEPESYPSIHPSIRPSDACQVSSRCCEEQGDKNKRTDDRARIGTGAGWLVCASIPPKKERLEEICTGAK